MDDIVNQVPTLILGGVAAFVMSLLTLFVARKTGLTDIQVQVRKETDSLIAAQDKRIELLESEVAHLQKERDKLKSRVLELEAEVKDLKEAIVQKVVPSRRRS